MAVTRLTALAVATALALTACAAGTPSVKASPSGGFRLPPAAGRFDYQLGGAYRPPAGVVTVVRDRGASAVKGAYNVCYLNGFQAQAEESSWWKRHHPTLLLAAKSGYIGDPDWPGEILFDTSTAVKREQLLSIVGGWIDGCAAHGFNAIEPDNLDSWTRSHGRLDRADNVAFAQLLAARGHARELAVAQKNAAELASAGRRIGFDFAIAEECQVFAECGAYTAAYGRHVLEVEYTDNGRSAFRASCAAHKGKVSLILRDRDLLPAGSAGYAYSAC